MSPKQTRRRAEYDRDENSCETKKKRRNEREKERKHSPKCALLKRALQQDALSSRTEKP